MTKEQPPKKKNRRVMMLWDEELFRKVKEASDANYISVSEFSRRAAQGLLNELDALRQANPQ